MDKEMGRRTALVREDAKITKMQKKQKQGWGQKGERRNGRKRRIKRREKINQSMAINTKSEIFLSLPSSSINQVASHHFSPAQILAAATLPYRESLFRPAASSCLPALKR